MRFLNVWRHAYAARGVFGGPTICGSGRRGRMRWEVPVCWGVWGGSRWRGCRERLIGAGAGAANCAAVGSAAFTRCARGARPRGAGGS